MDDVFRNTEQDAGVDPPMTKSDIKKELRNVGATDLDNTNKLKHLKGTVRKKLKQSLETVLKDADLLSK